MFSENTEYEILTTDGWKDFRGVTLTPNKVTCKILLASGVSVSATKNHYFFSNGIKIQLKDLCAGQYIDTINGPSQIVSIRENATGSVFDIIEVDQIEHKFIVNGSIITKNCDELAFVRNTIAQEFWTSISPTLSTGGKAIITSTPNSDEDQFWQLWLEANKTVDEFGNETGIGRNGFKAFTALWNEHPDRDQKWADDELGRIGSEKFSREHLCQPIIFEETLINAMTLTKLSAIDPVDKLGQVRWYKKPSRGNTYAIGVDPSLGTGGDYSAIEIYELPSFEQVGEWQHNKTPIQGQVRILRDIIKYIYDIIGTENDIYYSIENNGVGEATLMTISEVGEQNIKGIFLSEGGKSRKGFTTTHKSKLTACAKFKQLIEMGKLKINSKNLISELKTFVRANLSYAARVGDTDDLVSASLLVIRIMQTLQNYDSEIDNQMRANDEFVAPLPFIMI